MILITCLLYPYNKAYNKKRRGDTLEIRKATIQDIKLITELRITFLRLFEENQINQEQIKQYFMEHIPTQQCTFLLTYDHDKIVGTGAIYYYRSIPSNQCPTGRIGHITSMWVNPYYRIAKKLLDGLIADAKGKCDEIQLSSSADGINLYEKYGFKKKEDVYTWTIL